VRHFLHVRLEDTGRVEIQDAGTHVAAILEVVFSRRGYQYEDPAGASIHRSPASSSWFRRSRRKRHLGMGMCAWTLGVRLQHHSEIE
jgi:hypothetical protein